MEAFIGSLMIWFGATYSERNKRRGNTLGNWAWFFVSLVGIAVAQRGFPWRQL